YRTRLAACRLQSGVRFLFISLMHFKPQQARELSVARFPFASLNVPRLSYFFLNKKNCLEQFQMEFYAESKFASKKYEKSLSIRMYQKESLSTPHSPPPN
ncbi:MAG: hypothetical protein II957_11150, partial [Treponema sp.]|nr:hypothetical protein [Treponema sp.]